VAEPPRPEEEEVNDISDDRIRELRENIELCLGGYDAPAFDVIDGWVDLGDLLDAYAALKEENDQLVIDLSHHQHDLFYEKQAREKAEAELEAARPAIKFYESLKTAKPLSFDDFLEQMVGDIRQRKEKGEPDEHSS
jgi:hypothetical protein